MKNVFLQRRGALKISAVALAAALALTGCANLDANLGAAPEIGNSENSTAEMPTWEGEWPPNGEFPSNLGEFPGGFPGEMGNVSSGVEIPGDVTAALADNLSYQALADLDSATWSASQETAITLTGTSATVTGASTANVKINANHINITAPGTYRISGTLTDGAIVVNSDDDGIVRLVLDNASITNQSGSPLAIMDADRTAIILAPGTSNSLTDAATYADTSSDAPVATLHAEDDLVIAGTGRLNIVGNSARAINAKDGLVIGGGILEVEAVDDGIRGQDYLVILDGTINVVALDDGLISNAEPAEAGEPTVGYVAILGGDITVDAEDDAITAETEVIIGGGTVRVTRSYEGIEGANVLIAGGEISVVSSDDGVNAASDVTNDLSIVISGGTLTVDAAGDGLDSNGVLHQIGGDVVIYGPTGSGDSSLDADGGVTLDGGTLFAVGSAGMLVSPSSNSGQSWLVAPLSGTAPAGSLIEIRDASGVVVASLVSQKPAAAVTYAGPALVAGASYSVSVNGTAAGTAVADQATQGRRGSRPGNAMTPGGGGGQGGRRPRA